jgi:hypothetical protein
MSHLKYAFDLGYKEAIKEAEMTPAQMQAAQISGGVGGGLAGAAGGGLLGKYLGEHVGRAFNEDGVFSRYDPTNAGLVGAGIGGLLGGGAGGVLGSQLPRALGRTTPAAHPGEERIPGSLTDGPVERGLGGSWGEESSLGALPSAYDDYDPYAEQMYQQAMSGQHPDYYGGY